MTGLLRPAGATPQQRGTVHTAVEDPDAPGCCLRCGRPTKPANDRHVPAEQMPAVPEHVTSELARRAGDRED